MHIDHGIGRYEGLKTLDIAQAPHDCLHITYAGDSTLYLPVENIDLLTRYGAEGEGSSSIAWAAPPGRAARPAPNSACAKWPRA